MLLCPAVTPWKSTLPGVGANNPSIRLFKYDRDTGIPQSYIQYYLNLTAANMKNSADNWQKEYDTSDVYAIDEIRPTKVHSLLKAFSDKSNGLFKHYLQYNSVQWDSSTACNDTCFQRHICAISELDFDNFRTCLSGGKTTAHPGHSTTHHHHPKQPLTVPNYMYYVIGGLAAVVFLLFIIIATMCWKKGGRVRAPKYAKFGSLSINEHIWKCTLKVKEAAKITTFQKLRVLTFSVLKKEERNSLHIRLLCALILLILLLFNTLSIQVNCAKFLFNAELNNFNPFGVLLLKCANPTSAMLS